MDQKTLVPPEESIVARELPNRDSAGPPDTAPTRPERERSGDETLETTWHGIPAVHWWFGGGSNFLYNHTPLDDITQISESSLETVGEASQHFIASLDKLQALDFTLPTEKREELEAKLKPHITPEIIEKHKCRS